MAGNDDNNNNSTGAKYVAAALAIAGVAVNVWSLFSGTGSGVGDKMMKAPGQPGVQIPRNVFEKDPSAYFRNFRKN